MFTTFDDGVLNLKRVTTIEIDKDTASEINYLFNDGGLVKEKFENDEMALAKFTILADINLFIPTNDNKLINSMYIKDIEQDLLNEKKLVYVLYGGAPVKEVYNSSEEVLAAIEALKVTLESIGDTTEDETTIDLTPYLKKIEASSIYATQTALIEGLAAKADITAIPDVTGFATQGEVATKAEKTYVDTELAKKANIADIPEIPEIPEVPDISNLATKDELSAKADINEVPTKTSELTNDSDFVTGTDLQGLGAQFSAQMQEMNTQNAQSFSNLEAKIPTKTSQLTNDSGYVGETEYNDLIQRIEALEAALTENQPQE